MSLFLHPPKSFQAILFDLDGTLLDSNMDTFLPHYLQRLAGRVSHLSPPKAFIAHLLAATDAMVANDGHATNEEVFAAAFYPFAGHTRAELEPIFQDFYANDFPALSQHTQRKPDARPVVQRAFDLGYDVVIATNPLFPATAVQQRLEWAGVADFPYRWITSYENSRTCKPNLRYFDEICRQIGQPPAACLMVGDEAMDMVASRLGMTTFLVPGASTHLDDSVPEPTYRGSLADLAGLLER
ncbi:MAG: HAD family hydrolase [Chloroflexi bacterium]|nr:HAD family hydrolase [Chloroflexota bacterium]